MSVRTPRLCLFHHQPAVLILHLTTVALILTCYVKEAVVDVPLLWQGCSSLQRSNKAGRTVTGLTLGPSPPTAALKRPSQGPSCQGHALPCLPPIPLILCVSGCRVPWVQYLGCSVPFLHSRFFKITPESSNTIWAKLISSLIELWQGPAGWIFGGLFSSLT